MANLYRLTFFLVFFFLHSLASAVTPEYLYKYSTFQGTASEIVAQAQSNSPTRSCWDGSSPAASWYSKNANSSSVEIWMSSAACPGYSPYDGYQFTASYIGIRCPSGFIAQGSECVPDPDAPCTANAEKVNGVCQCKVGYIHQNGGCAFDTKKACSNWEALNYVPGGILTGAEQKLSGVVQDGAVFCEPYSADGAPSNAGCRIQFEQLMVATNHDGSKTSYGKWAAGYPSSTNKDLSCTVGTASTDTPSRPSEAPCPNGSPGTVNGVTVCVPRPPNNGVETGGTDSSTINDGTNTTQTENNKTTVCKDGKCTTTTVTTTTVTNNATGSATTSNTTSQTTTSQGDFCAKNPKNAQCNGTGTGTGGNGDGEEDPSQFGGACAAGFTCKGDAIQCAIAQEQHKRSCRLFDDPNPESQLYDANKGKDGKQTTDLPGNETVNVAGRIDSTDSLGAGASGVADLNVTVWGQSVSLPFSMLNPYLAALGNVLLAVSFLLALRIVARG